MDRRPANSSVNCSSVMPRPWLICAVTGSVGTLDFPEVFPTDVTLTSEAVFAKATTLSEFLKWA